MPPEGVVRSVPGALGIDGSERASGPLLGPGEDWAGRLGLAASRRRLTKLGLGSALCGGGGLGSEGELLEELAPAAAVYRDRQRVTRVFRGDVEAASKALGQLERYLGVRLFHRTSRGIQITRLTSRYAFSSVSTCSAFQPGLRSGSSCTVRTVICWLPSWTATTTIAATGMGARWKTEVAC